MVVGVVPVLLTTVVSVDLSSCLRRILISLPMTVAKDGFSLLSYPAKRTRVDTLGVVNQEERPKVLNVQCFLEVSKAELVGHLCDGLHKLVWEIDVFVGRQFVLPVLGIKSTLPLVRIIEKARGWMRKILRGGNLHLQFSIKATGPSADTRVKTVKMVGRANDQ